MLNFWGVTFFGTKKNVELSLFDVFVVFVWKVYDLSIYFASGLAMYDEIMMNESIGACTYFTAIYFIYFLNIAENYVYSVPVQPCVLYIIYIDLHVYLFIRI